MQNTVVLILFFSCLWHTLISSYKLGSDMSILSDGPFVPSDNNGNHHAECLSKEYLAQMFSRDRRASISRPYFQHWRAARENARSSKTNFPAFSPRLGKRALTDEEQTSSSMDSNNYFVTLYGHFNQDKIDVIYEDTSKMCSAQMINGKFIDDFLKKIGVK